MIDNTIDIVLPWVNPMDKQWQAEFIKYKRLAGDKSDNRFRDAGTLPYWFKLIRKNTKFKYRIVLIVASESQLPKWLNKDAEDLRIVYHREFIPSSELPTFSSNVINCYIPFIPDLNEHYILFNDDIFMIKPTQVCDWFYNNKPKFYCEQVVFPRARTIWDTNIANCQRIVNAFMSSQIFITPEHAPLPHIRSIDLFVWTKLRKILLNALSQSKFRSHKNVTDWLFSMVYIAGKFGTLSNNPISTYFNTENIWRPNTKIVCYNDTELIKDHKKYMYNLISILKGC